MLFTFRRYHRGPYDIVRPNNFQERAAQYGFSEPNQDYYKKDYRMQTVAFCCALIIIGAVVRTWLAHIVASKYEETARASSLRLQQYDERMKEIRASDDYWENAGENRRATYDQRMKLMEERRNRIF